jgi:monothiol bacilliredoxin
VFGFFRKQRPVEDSIISPMRTEEDFDTALERSMKSPVLLFKHSCTCGTSFFARREVQSLGNAEDPPVYEIVVQDARRLSNQVASRFGIRHASPQAILVRNGKAIWSTSHGGITSQSIRLAVRDAA